MTTTARLRRFAAIGLLVCTAAVTGCAADTDSPGSDTGQQTAETPGPRSDYDRCVLKMFDIIDRALVDLAGGAGISEVTDRADDQAENLEERSAIGATLAPITDAWESDTGGALPAGVGEDAYAVAQDRCFQMHPGAP